MHPSFSGLLVTWAYFPKGNKTGQLEMLANTKGYI